MVTVVTNLSIVSDVSWIQSLFLFSCYAFLPLTHLFDHTLLLPGRCGVQHILLWRRSTTKDAWNLLLSGSYLYLPFTLCSRQLQHQKVGDFVQETIYKLTLSPLQCLFTVENFEPNRTTNQQCMLRWTDLCSVHDSNPTPETLPLGVLKSPRDLHPVVPRNRFRQWVMENLPSWRNLDHRR